MPQEPPERSAVNVENALFNPARASLDPILLDAMSPSLQQPRAHQGSKRQRDEARRDDGDYDGNREFAEDAAHKARHEHERKENRGERDGHGKNCETDLLGAIESRLQRRLSL